MASSLTLAAAGSRKTQSIIDSCAAASPDERILILTYTTANQCELKSRLATQVGHRPNVRVSGWFSFLIGEIVRPYLPYAFRHGTVTGFDFHGSPTRLPLTSSLRYLTPDGRVRKAHLAQLATRIESSSNGMGLRTLARSIDRIYIDEVQDLNGYDLDCLELLLKSGITVEMVGDIRQAIMVTNPQERRNQPYKFMAVWRWFREQEQKGLLRIQYKSESWRCSTEICALADSLFRQALAFPPTVSMAPPSEGHAGIFLVRDSDVAAYVGQHAPLFLRDRVTSGNYPGLELRNIGDAKGMTRAHVLIHPTSAFASYLQRGAVLEDQQAARLYVAVTRAQHSVAFVLNTPGNCVLPYWAP